MILLCYASSYTCSVLAICLLQTCLAICLVKNGVTNLAALRADCGAALFELGGTADNTRLWFTDRYACEKLATDLPSNSNTGSHLPRCSWVTHTATAVGVASIPHHEGWGDSSHHMVSVHWFACFLLTCLETAVGPAPRSALMDTGDTADNTKTLCCSYIC